MFNKLLQATATVANEGTVDALKFTTENLSEALICSLAGMAGIFIVVVNVLLSIIMS